MKVIDVNLNVTSQQYADLHEAERIDLRLNVSNQIGDTIQLYSIEGIKAMISEIFNENKYLITPEKTFIKKEK